MFNLINDFSQRPWTAAVVGCGGTGGWVAEGLARILPPETNLLLVDHDTVEERNLARQNFYPEDLGAYKAEALAHRLARRYRRAVAYSVAALEPGHRATRFSGLLVGCVDIPQARQALATVASQMYQGWWIDAGNGASFGQVLIGNATRGQLQSSFCREHRICTRLPLPSLQRPALLLEPPPVAADDPSCTVAVDIGEQSPTINQAMAAIVLEVVRRIVLGTCPWMSLSLDLEAGQLGPTLATPENVGRCCGLAPAALLVQGCAAERRRRA